MGDFEQASHNAMRNTFPGAQMGGCQFHYCQAVWKKCQKLGLTDTYKSNARFKMLVKKLMSIPYLPAHLIEGTATALFTADVNVDIHTMTKIRKLKAYFFRFWVRTITPQRLSVHQFPHSTNNFAESFHSRIKAIMRSHRPAIWAFCAYLTNIITDSEKDLERLDNGLNITRPRKPAYIQNMARRADHKEKFLAGNFTAMEYVTALSHTMDSNLLLLETGVTAGIGLGTEDEEDVAEPQGNPGLVCIVCLAPRERTIMLRPCNHAMLCAPCNDQLAAQNSSCPYCRGNVTERVEVYLR